MKYRAEIDGLRALAVVPVILFHAGFELFSGGFVGVDVFFVISGYLITTILIDDIERNRFSIVDFYTRRARRILPALFFVMLVCIPFAWMWMPATQMKDFSQSLAAVSLFISNFLFWRESGYFDGASEEKPLLHTWSLAVEEQYYLLFPIFLLWIWRFGKNRVLVTIVVCAAISLAFSEWGWRNNASANFYLAPSRVWELFAGSIAALIVQKKGVQSNNALSMLGLIAIVFSIFFYGKSTPFPSVYALVPVGGVVLLVMFAGKETLAARLLGARPFVGIGLISYSAYLWHQPLFAFARIRLLEAPSTLLMCSLSVIALFLGAMSWKFVEQPFRSSAGLIKSKAAVLQWAGCGLSVFLLIGIVGHAYKGYPARIDISSYGFNGLELSIPNIRKSIGCKDVDLANLNASVCTFNPDKKPIEIAVLGDSHSDVVAMALAGVGHPFVHLGLAACPPLVGADVALGNFDIGVCKRLADTQLEYVKANPNIRRVILVARWSWYTDGSYHQSMKQSFLVNERNSKVSPETSRRVFEEALFDTLDRYKKAGVDVTLLLQVPQQMHTPEELVSIGHLQKLSKDSLATLMATENQLHLDLQKTNREIMARVAAQFDNVDLLNLDSVFCSGRECAMLSGDDILYRDDDHLNPIGARKIANTIVEAVD